MARGVTRPLLVVVAVTVVVGIVGACGGSSETERSGNGLAAKKVTIDGLDVTVTPVRLDAGGAEFKVAFDTHTEAPGIDVAANSALVIGGTPWTNGTWSGDGPGGHHRAGTLRFGAAGPARGAARLTISGLDRPVEANWELP